MKTIAYLQITPSLDSNGQLKSIKPSKVSAKPPLTPLPGITLRLEIEIPDSAFAAITAKLNIPEDAVTHPVKVTFTDADAVGE